MITVKELIETTDKTVNALSKEIGINRLTLVNISERKSKASEPTALLICKYFGVDIKEVEEFQVLYNLGTSNKENPRRKKTSPQVKKTKERKIVVTKQYPCFNHNCPLCKDDLCNSDIVNADIAECYSKGMHKEKEGDSRIIHSNGKVGITVVKNARKARKESKCNTSLKIQK